MRFTNWPFSRKYTLYAVHIAFLKPVLVNCTVFFLGLWTCGVWTAVFSPIQVLKFGSQLALGSECLVATDLKYSFCCFLFSS